MTDWVGGKPGLKTNKSDDKHFFPTDGTTKTIKIIYPNIDIPIRITDLSPPQALRQASGFSQ